MSEGESAAAASETTTTETTTAPATPPSASADLGVGQPEPAWHEGKGYNADAVALMETKGWHKAEDPVAEMAKGYANLERLRGVKADQLVRIPEPGNEEQAAEFYSRLGVPESAEGYESPQVNVNGTPLDTAPLASISHALRHTPEQHAAFMEQVGAYAEQAMQAQFDARNAQLSAEKAELDQAWGPAAEENQVAARKGFGELGWEAETVDAVEQAIGYRATMELGAFIGRKLGEATQATEPNGSASMAYGLTTDAAREQLKVRGHELAEKIRNGDRAAKAELDRLNQVAWHS